MPRHPPCALLRLISIFLAIDVIPFTPTTAESGRLDDGIRPSIVKEQQAEVTSES